MILLALHGPPAVEIHRVKPPSEASGIRPMWCAPDFHLDAAGPGCSRQDLSGAAEGLEGAFVLNGVLSREEAERMVAVVDEMGFEHSSVSGRCNGALTWIFHDELNDLVARRIAPLLPWGVAVHSPGTLAPTEEQLPALDGVTPWVRQIGGAPEGLYVLNGLNARMRIYRYEGGGTDRFSPHYDEVWPGSRLSLQGGEPSLEQDCWKYSADHRWAWAAGECVSHLTVLLYLNDDFEGGETVLYPGTHASETPEDGSPQVAIRPAAGSALCFGQSFKFGREGVAHSSDSLLHEGAPLASPTGGSASAKYVLRTDVCYTLPRR